MVRKISEAAIRVGADGAEWLVWQSRSEALASGRMTSSYSHAAALDQWIARTVRLHMKLKRIWLIAGAAECAHRRITIPGTDLKVISQAIPLAIEEDLPLPLSQMYWTYRTQVDETSNSTIVEVVATPISLYTDWEEAIRERKIDIAGRIPEGPHLWLEMAAMRGSDIDLLTVWGERRATLIRGNEQGMSSLLAFVREPGEPWEDLLADLRRPFQSRDESKSILSIFTSRRLQKRIEALPDLLPPKSEHLLNSDNFLNVPEQQPIPVSLLALRRLRLEGREPGILFGDIEAQKPRVEFKRVATGVEIPWQAVAVVVALMTCLSLWWASGRVGQRFMNDLQVALGSIRDQQGLLDMEKEALSDLSKVRSDWGSVWLQLSQEISPQTTFKDFSFSQGAGIRVDGITSDQDGVFNLVNFLKKTGYLDNVRIIKTEKSDKQLSFQLLADFKPGQVSKFLVDPSKVPVGVDKPPASDSKLKEKPDQAEKQAAKARNRADRPRKKREKANQT